MVHIDENNYCHAYFSNDGVLTFCEDHRIAAGYLYKTIKILEHYYTDEILLFLSYSYLELIIRLRLLFQHIFAHKRTAESSIGHLNRIKMLRVLTKPLKNINRQLNAFPLGDAAHQERVQKILDLGYVKIMHTVHSMLNIQEDIKMNNNIIPLARRSQWNNRLQRNN